MKIELINTALYFDRKLNNNIFLDLFKLCKLFKTIM